MALKPRQTLVLPSSSIGQLCLPHPPHSPLLHPKPQFSLSLRSPRCSSSGGPCLLLPWLGLLALTLLVMTLCPAQSEQTGFVLHRKTTCNGPKVEPGCFLTHSMPGAGMAASQQCWSMGRTLHAPPSVLWTFVGKRAWRKMLSLC